MFDALIQAVQAAMRWAMETHDNTLIFGEDVAKPGGPFDATKGLYEAFGVARVFDTAISETAMLGMALGAAMTGTARSSRSCTPTSCSWPWTNW